MTIETDSIDKSFLQNLTIDQYKMDKVGSEDTDLINSPMNLGYKKGSPPAKLIFFIPALRRYSRPLLASGMDSMNEFLAV